MIGELRTKLNSPLRLLLLALGVLVLFLLTIWFARMSLAKSFMSNWCGQRNLSCEAEFTALSLSEVNLQNLRIVSSGETPVAAETVRVDLNWQSFFKPEIAGVNLQAPVIRGAFLDGALSLYGFENALLPMLESDETDAANASPPPRIDIADGELIMETEAGEVQAQFFSSGTPFKDGQIVVRVEPAHLSHAGAEVEWSRGEVDISFENGLLIGGADIQIERATLQGLTVQDVQALIQFVDQENSFAVELDGEAETLAYFDHVANQAEINGLAEIQDLQALSAAALLQGVNSASLEASAEAIVTGGVQTEEVEIDLALAHQNDQLVGPVSMKASKMTQEMFTAELARMDGQIALSEQDGLAYEYQGAVDLEGARVITGSFAPLTAPEPFAAHSRALDRALRRAATGFETRVEFTATSEAAGWTVQAEQPVELSAASGLSLKIEPLSRGPWLLAKSGELDLSGNLTLAGGGAPSLRVALEDAQSREAGIKLTARNAKLSPWQAEQRIVQFDFETLQIATGETPSLTAKGEIGLRGDYSGVTLDQTRLLGHLTAAQSRVGWNVQTRGEACPQIRSDGLKAGTLELDGFNLAFCPVDGRYLRQQGSETVGRVRLGDLDLGFKAGENSGVFMLEDAGVEWFVGDGFRVFLTGETLTLPLNISDRTLEIASQQPSVVLGLEDGPLQINATLQQTDFGGTLVPAAVSARDFTFEGVAGERGIQADLRSANVSIRDLNEDAIYNPLMANLSGTLDNGTLRINGPITGETSFMTVANTELVLDLSTLNGRGAVNLVPLDFMVDGLQPVDLSDFLRDILINAAGRMEGGADFLIEEGNLSGTGFVSLQDMSFETLRVGPVSGVNGRLNFTDILALTTAPGQRFTVDRMNPGVPLENGVIDLQILDAKSAGLEQGRWPFAGGELSVAPVTWLLGSQDPMRVVLEAKELKLTELVEVFNVPDLQAEGTVSGSVPVEIQGANLMVRNATLKADQEGGYISYTGDAGEAAKAQNDYAEYAFQALQDLYYSVMEIGADGNLIGDIVITAKLLGKSPDVLGGAEFDFNLSVDSNLFQLLQTTRSQAGQTYIREALELERQQAAEAAANATEQ